ncbi:MAG: VWA domain-containing protein [Rhizobiales bacterium]|nr:VWA domain-containing protein [Hyphomicrobiales bacterium]
MSNELDKLEQAFRNEGPILPREEARKAAISAAMDRFDEENLEAPQGNVVGARLKAQGNKLLDAIRRRQSMTLTTEKLGYFLTGGASIAAMALIAINTGLVPELTRQQGWLDNAPVAELEGASKEQPRSELAKQPVVKNEVAQLPEEVDALSEPEARVVAEKKAVARPAAPKLSADLVDQSVPRADAAKQRRARSAGKTSTRARAKLFSRESTLGGQNGTIAQFSMNAGQAKRSQRPADVLQPPQYEDQGRDKFSSPQDNPVKVVAEDPVSTFSVDVDTASYAFLRASLNRGVLPQKNAVRIEELINYFDYDYKGPDDRAQPFKANVAVMPTPWNTETKLMRIGIKGYQLPKTERPRTNLVFLLDTSGSMRAPNKLPLLRSSFKLLLNSLQADDTVSIVTYAGSAGTVLQPTKVSDKAKILGALDRLNAGGSTAGAEGIRQAYRLAEQNAVKDGVNRVILATDGDFNVGITNPEELKSFVERKRKSGVSLSVLGFGMGNYNDALMQTLAQNGNGNAAYIDSLNEARKVLVKEAGSTLFTIAKDVKLQVEFNPAKVSEYRLIGYETRILKREDFNNDKVDAGDIGAGHTVTALYEITPAGAKTRLVDGLRYQKKTAETAADSDAGSTNEFAFLKIRYKQPKGTKSTLITTPVTTANQVADVAAAPTDARFAAAVAAFGQILKGGRYTGSYSYDDVIKLALSAKGVDEFGHRAEFINLVRAAKTAAALSPQKQ